MEIKIGDKVYQVEISEPSENSLRVEINGREYFFNRDELGRLISPEDLEASFEKSEVISRDRMEKEIRSPLAGVISAVMVKKGQEIKPGQKVATLIAMKMENEIVSEGYGKIKEIKVKEGQFINGGDVLITLE